MSQQQQALRAAASPHPTAPISLTVRRWRGTVQVRTKYGFDAPLPNAPRTLAKNNSVALDAQPWVMRLAPTDRTLTAPSRSWEQERVLAYVAQYTKEMAASHEIIRRHTDADHGGPPMNPLEDGASSAEPKRQRVA